MNHNPNANYETHANRPQINNRDIEFTSANTDPNKPNFFDHLNRNHQNPNGLNNYQNTDDGNYRNLPQGSPPNANGRQPVNNMLQMANGGMGAMRQHIQQNNVGKDEGFEEFDLINNKKLRLDFIKKTFGILGTQLLITFIVTLIPLMVESVRVWMHQNWWLCIVSSVLAMIILYVVIYTKAGRKVPINYVLIFLFTIFEAYTVAFIAARYQPETVALAAGLTTLIVITLSIYAACTKTDFTKCGGFLLICLVVLITGGILAFFFRNRILNLILSCLGVIVFGIYLIFDIQLLLGNKKNKFSKDDYILAAMMLYIDIIQIFIYILQIIGFGSGR